MIFQFLVNGIISGALIGILAIGFWFIYRCTNLFHIAHGAVYTASAYVFYSLYAASGVTLYISLPLALLAGAILGIGMYFIVYEPLERDNASDGVKFISSLAIYILMVNVIALVYGNETKILLEGISKSFSLGDIILIKIQVYQFIAFLIVLCFSYFFVQKTRAGRQIRAIGDNPLLFKALGHNEKHIKTIVFFIGSALLLLFRPI